MNFQFLNFLTSGCIVPYSVPGFKTEGNRLFWVGWGQPKRASQPCPSSFSLYAPDFFLRDLKPWFIFEEFAVLEEQVLLEEYRQFFERADGWHRPKWQWEAPSWTTWQDLFGQVQEQLRLGTFQKVVPVLFEKSDLKPQLEEKARILFSILSFTHSWPLAVYGLWGPSEGEEYAPNDQAFGLIGATPELLFESQAGIYRTMAVAGTRLKASGGPKIHDVPLLEDPKERKEHQWVIEGITDSLQKLSQALWLKAPSIQVKATQAVEFPTLSHLVTPIVCSVPTERLGFESFEHGVHFLHPTAALGTFPKTTQGMQYLETLDMQYGPRRRLGAPFGFQSPNGQNQACYVGIRHLEWGQWGSRVGAGCGVISVSQIRAEWEEILGKMQSVKQALGVSG